MSLLQLVTQERTDPICELLVAAEAPRRAASPLQAPPCASGDGARRRSLSWRRSSARGQALRARGYEVRAPERPPKLAGEEVSVVKAVAARRPWRCDLSGRCGRRGGRGGVGVAVALASAVVAEGRSGGMAALGGRGAALVALVAVAAVAAVAAVVLGVAVVAAVAAMVAAMVAAVAATAAALSAVGLVTAVAAIAVAVAAVVAAVQAVARGDAPGGRHGRPSAWLRVWHAEPRPSDAGRARACARSARSTLGPSPSARSGCRRGSGRRWPSSWRSRAGRRPRGPRACASAVKIGSLTPSQA